MPRKVSLPASADTFRPTHGDDDTVVDPTAPSEREPRRQPSGRVRHDEKITVYVASEELLALEQARLRLRSEHALAVDRGRIVREAIHQVIEDFEANGERSTLVRRLKDR